MVRLLISGSRQCTPEMSKIARRCVEQAKQKGYSILVGDAEGIDHDVMLACCDLGVPFLCFGCTPAPRHICCVRHRVETGVYHRIIGGYLQRDRVMVNQCDLMVAIWNGRSRGTKYTYDYAVEMGKPAHIWTKGEHWQ